MRKVLAFVCFLAACGGTESGSTPNGPQFYELDAGSSDNPEASTTVEASDNLPTDAHDEATNADALGRACQSDADCNGFHCVRSTDDFGLPGSGGPPNGYCSFECTAQTQSTTKVPDVCAPLNAFCINFGAPGVKAPAWCMRKCQVGKNAKCLQRPDVVCVLNGLVNPRSLCTPMCSSDADCPGRVCDEVGGMCIARQPAHSPLYSSCLAGRTISVCAAYCLSRDDLPAGQTAPGLCSRPCPVDSPTACGRNLPEPVSSGHVGICFGGPEDGVGDLGSCLQFCDTAADCADKDPGTTCVDFNGGALGHGLCTPPGMKIADAGGPETGAPDAGGGETGAPEDSAAPDAGSLPVDAGQPDAD